ncbi:MAG: hypothetical protein CL605_05725 [Altibacter sp.]|nr:hypothetical protein [Altibacter sp.]
MEIVPATIIAKHASPTVLLSRNLSSKKNKKTSMGYVNSRSGLNNVKHKNVTTINKNFTCII